MFEVLFLALKQTESSMFAPFSLGDFSDLHTSNCHLGEFLSIIFPLKVIMTWEEHIATCLGNNDSWAWIISLTPTFSSDYTSI